MLFSTWRPHCHLFSVFQVWGHGAENNCGEGVWVYMLAEWGVGHSPACSCHSVKLQPHLPPKPAGGEATSPEGTAFLLLYLAHITFFVLLLSASFLCLCLTHKTVTGWILSFRIWILYCSSVYCICVLGGLKVLEYIPLGERNERLNDNDWTNDLHSFVCQQLSNSNMCIYFWKCLLRQNLIIHLRVTSTF